MLFRGAMNTAAHEHLTKLKQGDTSEGTERHTRREVSEQGKEKRGARERERESHGFPSVAYY